MPHLSFVALFVLVICSHKLHVTRAQNSSDQCRRQCMSALDYFGKFVNSSSYLENYLSSCYGRCPTGISYTQSVTTPYYQAGISPACGVQTDNRIRVVGGDDAYDCEFPWMAAVTVNNLFCGGTILDRRHVLTAAHCMKDKYTGAIASPSQVLVRVGSSYLSRLQVYRVLQINVNQRHVPVINDYDVAVLTLSGELQFSDCVGPICLPQTWEDPRRADFCVAAGWGIDNFYSTTLTVNLKKVTLPIVDSTLCTQSYGSRYMNELKICAGDYYRGGIDTCQGDSGGPLMCKYGNHYYVLGIVSFGSGCARPRYPGIYTRVAHQSIINFITQARRT